MINKPVVIVDYQMGNIHSLIKKINKIGYSAILSNDISIIKSAEKLILPGVGHFKKAMEKLKELNLTDILNEVVLVRKVPILGICLGLQLMANQSEEGDAKGLSWFNADVVRFNVSDKLKFKVPHIGWNNAMTQKESFLFKHISDDAMFYFVHSYHIKCGVKEDVLASTEYEYKFASAIQKENIFGIQFHPEKSHDNGERMLRNFLEL